MEEASERPGIAEAWGCEGAEAAEPDGGVSPGDSGGVDWPGPGDEGPDWPGDRKRSPGPDDCEGFAVEEPAPGAEDGDGSIAGEPAPGLPAGDS